MPPRPDDEQHSRPDILRTAEPRLQAIRLRHQLPTLSSASSAPLPPLPALWIGIAVEFTVGIAVSALEDLHSESLEAFPRNFAERPHAEMPRGLNSPTASKPVTQLGRHFSTCRLVFIHAQDQTRRFGGVAARQTKTPSAAPPTGRAQPSLVFKGESPPSTMPHPENSVADDRVVPSSCVLRTKFRMYFVRSGQEVDYET